MDGKTFHFQAQDSQERERWIRALEDTVLKHNQTRRMSSGLRKSALLVHSAGEAPTLLDFDKKLTETDCYLQILLNQVSALKNKMDDPETTPEAKAKYEDIAEKAVAMTESIKHGIVLLQIAKNATIPGANVSNTTGLDVSKVTQPHDIPTSGCYVEADTSRSPLTRPSRPNNKPTSNFIKAIENTFSDTKTETGTYVDKYIVFVELSC